MSESLETQQQHAPQQQQHQQSNIGIYGNKMNIIPNYTLSGMSSFDAESLPDYSEFDSESVTLDYYKERYLANDNNNDSDNNKQYFCLHFCFDSVSPFVHSPQ